MRFQISAISKVKRCARQVQGLLDSVKQKVRTARDITAGLEITDEPTWANESERILEEKQELISRLIVQSQQGDSPALSQGYFISLFQKT